MNARDELLRDLRGYEPCGVDPQWDPAAQLLAVFEAEVTAAAYRAAADLAEDVANELFGAYDTEQGNGAMAVAARLRARADQMGQQ